MIRREELSKIFRGNYGNRIFPPPISDEILENFPSEEDMIIKDYILSFPKWLMDVIIQSFNLEDREDQYDYIVENSLIKPQESPNRKRLSYPNFDLELDSVWVRVMLYIPMFQVSLEFDRVYSGMSRIRVSIGREAETPGKYRFNEKLYLPTIVDLPHPETLLKIESMINSTI